MARPDDDGVPVGLRPRPAHARFLFDAQDLEGGDPAVRAHDPAARMGRGAGQPEVADRRPEAGPAGHGPAEEQLLERELALEDVALGEAGRPLDVERCHHLAMEDLRGQVRRELGDPVDHRVAERLALVVPAAQ